MGIASRTKWERRAQRDNVEGIDARKLVHRCAILFRRLRAEEAIEAAKPHEQDWLRELNAERKLMIRRGQARFRRGWLPMGKR